MNPLTLSLLVLSVVLAVGAAPHRAQAYSYVAAGQEPLLQGRAALFKAVLAGDWRAAGQAFLGMKADIEYLDQHEDAGVLAAFTDALAARDPKAVRAAFLRAATDEIVRRLDGARDNLGTYQTAKTLVVSANAFFSAIEGDLPPGTAARVRAEMKHAIDAVGNPGVFGVGAVKADPQDFDDARTAILTALGQTP